MLKMFKSKTSGIFDLKGITIDFECAMIKALVIPYPLIDIHCCRFHLAKNWMEKIKKMKLLHHYRNANSLFGLWLKSLFILPAVSDNRISEFYFQHKSNVDISNLNRLDRLLANKFLKYLEKYYVGPRPKFPPKYWAGLVNKDSIRYSNNGAESFHSHFKHAFTGKNKKPNIFEFLVALGHFNIHNKVKLQSFKTLPPNQFSNLKDDHDKLLSGDMSIALI